MAVRRIRASGVPRDEIRFTAQPYDVVKPTTFRVSQPTHEGVILEVEPLGTIIGQVIRGKQPVPGASIDINGPNDRDLQPILADYACAPLRIHTLLPGRRLVPAKVRIFLDLLSASTPPENVVRP